MVQGGELVLRNLHDASLYSRDRTAFRTAFRLVAQTPSHVSSGKDAAEEDGGERATSSFCLMLQASGTARGAGPLVGVPSWDRSNHVEDEGLQMGHMVDVMSGDRPNHVEGEGLQVGVPQSSAAPTLRRNSRKGVEYESRGERDGPEGCGSRLLVRFGSPVAGYPAGAKLLTGRDRKYVIAPLSRIVEESYSTYLEWTGGADLVR